MLALPTQFRTTQVLVVDDSAPTRLLARTLLERRGFHVVDATGGYAAIEVLASTPIDLVISDLDMPEGTGLDLMRHVRETHPSLPVVLMTASPWFDGLDEFSHVPLVLKDARYVQSLARAVESAVGSNT